MRKPRAILADDHVVVREALALLLAPEVEVVAQASNGQELVAQARRLRPDLIVADLTMPTLGGLEALQLLRKEKRKAKVIMLTVHADASIAAEAMRAGAAGYVVKHAAGEELLQAVRLALAGRTYLSPLVSGDVVDRLARGVLAPSEKLTPRQAQVLRLLADGRRVKEVAATLGISVRTAETHKYEIMRLLEVDNMADLVKLAIRRGIVSS